MLERNGDSTHEELSISGSLMLFFSLFFFFHCCECNLNRAQIKNIETFFFFLSNGIGRGHKQKIDNLENKEGGADKKKNASKSQLISQKQHVQNAFLSGKRVGAEQHQKNNNIKRRHIASTACLLMLTNTHIRCEEARTQRSKLWRLHPPTRALFLFSFLFFFS